MATYIFTVKLDQDDANPDYLVTGGGWNDPLNNMMPMLVSGDTIDFSFSMASGASLKSVQLYSWPVTNDKAFPFADPADTILYTPIEVLENRSFTVTVAEFSRNFVAAFALVGTYLTGTAVLRPFLVDPEAMVSSGH